MKKISFIKKLKAVLYKFYHLFYDRERKTSYGSENPDKVFYVIGQDDTTGGLFWLVNKAVMHIAYAIEKGWIPVVDYQNHITQYTTNETVGKTNIWELFFQQPCRYSMEDIQHSKNIVIQKMSPAPCPYYLMGQSEFFDNEERIAYFRNYFNRYIHFNQTTNKHLTDYYERLFLNKGEIIGVLCRGTDYVVQRPKGHYVQPEPEMVIEDVKKLQNYIGGGQYVFLATEDADIFQKFTDTFGDKLLSIPQKRISKNAMDNKLYLASQPVWHEDDAPIEKALSYLTSMYLLSKCTYFLSGRTGGAKAVLLMNGRFKYKNIYNLGFYQ